MAEGSPGIDSPSIHSLVSTATYCHTPIAFQNVPTPDQQPYIIVPSARKAIHTSWDAHRVLSTSELPHISSGRGRLRHDGRRCDDCAGRPSGDRAMETFKPPVLIVIAAASSLLSLSAPSCNTEQTFGLCFHHQRETCYVVTSAYPTSP
ncbi:hypothetical protein PGT21_035321 [Puccinia graminis f. sp. tritici]|uniref:Uncharacterized protein n=1 Tax=Puccinia graminis f. sp. tritici TaxID=56615 RepID=A0A5B0S043_PUCGR|nr:hypothetical protein PGT21_035321 [Puccinia graminis f. sp. tritici]KAA1130134.1 hypothetical protein PGTUg99_004599 [Puccinia graminis f. sp. tritici]